MSSMWSRRIVELGGVKAVGGDRIYHAQTWCQEEQARRFRRSPVFLQCNVSVR